MRRAKIVCTFGPAIASAENTLAVLEAGVDVARMNMSHGDYSVHDNTYGTSARQPAAWASRWPSWPTCRVPRSAWAGSLTARTPSPG